MAAPDIRLTLFGAPSVAVGGAAQALAFERRTQLAVLLALRGQWVPRAELATMLWPEQENRLAFANLRKILFRLAKMPWTAPIESQTAALRFQVAHDVAAFEAALRDDRLDDALAAYRGDLLAGFDDGQSEAWTRWVGFERERLRAAWRAAALKRLADPDFAVADAIALSARLLDADPLDEAALQHHVEALARDGQAAAARQAYRQFVDRLAQDLGLEPGAALRALHDRLAGATGAVRAPAARPPAAPADDGFIGRSVELQRIGDLLQRDECRLLCLIGPGGVGKTRLARRATAALAPAFADGAGHVALEDIGSAEQLAQRLAQEAGVDGGPAGDALAGAIDVWRDQHRLLVLDNFEQLAEHAPLLERLLAECPRLKLLVTSRVRLAVAGEWSMPVEGLPCPDPEDEDRAESFDAVRLFVAAARRMEPAFEAAAERAAIVDICRRVEGLPLALELAAAWVRVLPCAAIAAELAQGTELLRSTDRRQPARHGSLEVVFEHSWRRLSAVERAALARLSVFHGGFTVEAARAVAGASLPVLGALSDKSLLAKEGARMHLHPLVQQLAALRLDADGGRAATEAAHAAYFHRWLRQLEPAAENGQRDALAAIDTEFENCRRAWHFAAAHAEIEALTGSVPTLVNHFDHRARFEEGLAMLQQAIDAPAGRQDARLRTLLQSQAALMLQRLTRVDEADATAAQVLAAPRGAVSEVARYRALAVSGACALIRGRAPLARKVYQRALAVAQACGRAHDIAATLDNLGLCEKQLGHYDEALRLSLEALALLRRQGDDARVALCLNNLGSMLAFMDDDAAAQAHLQEAMALSDRHGLVSTQAFVRANLTELAMKSGRLADARGHAEQALELAERARLRTLLGWLKVQLARLAARRDEPAPARALLADAAELALAIDAPSVKAAALLALAELLEAQGDASAARRVLAFAADEPTLSVPDRDELRAAWARRASLDTRDAPWPGLALDELLRRVVAARTGSFAALTSALDPPP